MALNKLLLITYFLTFSFVSYSQDLRITLSIEWDDAPIYLRGYHNRQEKGTPHLIIAYHNIGKHNIYFKKLKEPEDELLPITSGQPFMLSHSLVPIRTGETNCLNINTNSSSALFEIDLENPKQQYFNSLTDLGQNVIENWWTIRRKSDSIAELFTALNVEIINEILSRQLFLNTYDSSKQIIFFNYPHKEVIPYLDSYNQVEVNWQEYKLIRFSAQSDTTRFPVEKFKEDFCFVKAGETCIQKVNLLPLMVIGGTYKFNLVHHLFRPYIEIYPTDLRGNKFIHFMLPKQVQGYQLYTGGYLANSISVRFDPQNDKKFLTIGMNK